MKKLLLSAVLLAICAVFLNGNDLQFNVDFANKATLSGEAGHFPNVNNLRVEKRSDGKTALIIRRGAWAPKFQLAEAIKENEDCGFSFKLTRITNNSAMCISIHDAAVKKFAGLTFVNPDGFLMVMNPETEKYVNTKVKLDAGKKYLLSVKINAIAKTTAVYLNDKLVQTVPYKYNTNLNTITFSAQLPVDNLCAIEDFSFYRKESSPVFARQLITDFGNPETYISDCAYFMHPQKLTLEKRPDGKTALIIRRGGWFHRVKLNSPLTDTEDFGYSFDFTRLQNNSSTCFGFKTAKEQYTALAFCDMAGTLRIMNRKTGGYEDTGFKLEPNKKYNITVSVNSNAQVVTVAVKGKGSYQVPNVFYPETDEFQFSPQQPQNNTCAIENFRFFRKQGKIICRENGLKGAEVGEIVKVKSAAAQKLTDGYLHEPVFLPEKCEFEIILPKRINATAVQIYGGNPGTLGYPSGACAPRAFLIEGLCNGAWVTLADEKNAPNVWENVDFAREERVLRYDCKATYPIDKVRVKFLRSHDTGKRISGDCKEEDRGLNICEIEILSDKVIARQVQLAALLAAEYRLPFYRDMDKAELTIVAEANSLTPLKGTIEIADPAGKIIRTLDAEWKHGRNNIVIDNIGNLPSGRYMTTIKTEAGEIKRLLRIEKTAEIKAPAAPLAMTGKKLFFTPDKFTFKEWNNLNVVTGDTKAIKQAQTPSPDKLLHYGNRFYRAQDGRYVIQVSDLDYKADVYLGRPKHYIRVLASDSIEGPYTPIDKAPPALPGVVLNKKFQPCVFPQPARTQKFELYDPAEHGKLDLSRLYYVYNYGANDYGCLKAEPRTYYVTYLTPDGKWLITNPKPLFKDCGYYGEKDFDNGFMTNDNFGGMWLSPDGKECFWAQGQTVKRSAPYAVRYDNLQTGLRFVTVYSTRDGVNWKMHHTLTATDTNDPVGQQHYGANIVQIADGDLYLCRLFSYDATAQQIYVDIAYSRDGVDFHKIDKKPFLRTHDPNEWYYGHSFLNHQVVREGNYWYEQAGYCTPMAHFYFEAYNGASSLAAVKGSVFRQRFEDRGLAENWPHFEKVGGYDGLAKLTNKGGFTSGIIKFRVDGWFYLQAKDQDGTFSTNLMNANGKITANAEIAADGFIKLELCSADGKVLAEKIISGDSTEIPVFDTVPAGDFFIRGTMKNAKLYTLNF